MKKILYSLLIMIITFPLFSKSYSATTYPSLIAEYDFEKDFETTIVDTTGNNNGTATGTALVTGYDGNGNARLFNGASDFISFNKPIIPNNKMSIRFKINTTQNVSGDIYPTVFDTKGSTTNGIVGFVRGGRLQIQLWDRTFNGVAHFIADGEWHDVLFTWDGTTNSESMKLYVDDMTTPKNINSTTFTSITHSKNLRIGHGQYANGVYFKGQLDNFQIYNDSIEPEVDSPTQPQKDKGTLYVSNNAFYKLTESGDVYSWGENNYGQLGLGDTEKRSLVKKEKVNLPEKIIDLVVGKNFVVVIGESSKVYGWGDNTSLLFNERGGLILSPVEFDENIGKIYKSE
ncbi:LamG-like jellyroll fold domain-containing protein [Lysinibacillus sp. NPDC047702]|uniref:LamG domain-containing protein n=1 Tax=unclassified Lysinibacillus TaxID=2636778 RepID=UPI003CFFA37C